MNNIFKVNQIVPYDLRTGNVLQSRNPNSVQYGTKTISYIAPKNKVICAQNNENL